MVNRRTRPGGPRVLAAQVEQGLQACCRGAHLGHALEAALLAVAGSTSSKRCSFDGKWCSSPGWLSPTSCAIVASDAPRKPCLREGGVGGGEDRVASLAALRVSASLPARVLTAREPSRAGRGDHQ